MKRNLADDILKFISNLEITSGEYEGQKPYILPWQEGYIRGTFREGIKRSALSIARGNGKTTLCGWLAAAVVHPDGPLRKRNARVVVAAASHEQGAIIHKQVLDLLPDRDDKKRWSIWDSNRLKIECKETGAALTVMSFNPGAAHGLQGVSLFVLDELAQWPEGRRDKQFNALDGALGKTPDAVMCAIGTRPENKDNPFTKLLDGQADFVLDFRSKARKQWWRESAYRLANPSVDHFPALKAAIESDIALARRDPAKQAAYCAYRLNQGVSETEQHNSLITAGVYGKTEVDDVAIKGSNYVLGLDLSGGHAMTAVAAVSLDADYEGKHCVDAVAYWPETAKLKERGQADGCNYEAMHSAGDLILLPGPTVSVDTVLADAFARWGRPVAVVSDFFRITESRWALNNEGFFEDDDTFVTRRFGPHDGSADVRAFRRMIADKKLAIRKSMLLRQSFSGARTQVQQGNEWMQKENERSTRGKDDVAAAIVISVAEVQRRTRDLSGAVPARVYSFGLAGAAG